jgi:hypothetical protein
MSMNNKMRNISFYRKRFESASIASVLQVRHGAEES